MQYSRVQGDGAEEGDEQELHRGEQPVVEQSSEPEPADAITVKVRSADEKTHEVRVSASETVLGLKRILEPRTGLPPPRQRLICQGRLLDDAQTLKASSVGDGVFIHLVPKPASACRPATQRAPSVSSNGSERDDPELALPAHIQEMLAARAELASATPIAGLDRFSYEDEYELGIWRYRVRVLSLMMCFYYFLTLMASLSMWLHPENAARAEQQGQFRQVKSDVPLAVVDTLENVLGIAVALVGLKTAVSTSVPLARRYLREITTLSLVHFCNLFMWIAALLRGEIVQVPIHHRMNGRSHEEAAESLRSVVTALLIVHPMMWAAILTIAHRHYKLLALRDAARNPPVAQPAAQPAEADAGDDPLAPIQVV